VRDEAAAFAAMTRLVKHHDPDWQLSLSDHDRQKLMREIVVFEIDLTKVEVKFKLSQDRGEEDQAKIEKQLAGGESDNQRETAAMMAVVNSRL